MVIKIIMLAIFFGVMIGIGFYARKQATDVNGFVLGGRSVGPWLTAFAYGTSYFSAVIFIGYAGQFGWKYGIASTWIGLGNAIIGSLIAWVVLGRRTRLITQKMNSRTMPEFFEKRYSSKSLKLFSSIIIFIFLIPYTASLYNGLSRLFGMAFNIDYKVCVIVMAALTGIYVIVGGYMATAINDFIQGLIMLVGIVAIIGAVLNNYGGLAGALDKLARVTDTTVSDTPGIFASFLGPDIFNLFCVVVLTSLGTWGLPQMVQKFYAIKDERSVKTGTVVSTFFALIVAGGCYFLGGFGRLTNTDVAVEGYDAIIPHLLECLPPILIGLVVILVLSASMSTLSSLVLTSSSTLTIDFIKPVIAPKMSDKKQVLVMRIMLVVFVAISAVIAVIQYSSKITFIAQLMGVSWGAIAGAFLAPFLYGLYWKRTTVAACWVSFIWGAGIMTLNFISNTWGLFSFPTLIQSPINCGALAMVGGLILVPVVSLITKAPDQDMVNEAFSCYSETTEVARRKALD
jgi:SSS family solute:Na+ symporter